MYELLRVILAAGRDAEFGFEEAWTLALEAVLAYQSEPRAQSWWDVLDSTRPAWADAYAGRRSLLAALDLRSLLAEKGRIAVASAAKTA